MHRIGCDQGFAFNILSIVSIFSHSPISPGARLSAGTRDWRLQLAPAAQDTVATTAMQSKRCSPSDAVTASLWSASDDVLVCDDKIINVDDEETVQVHQIR
jgi:hypothetical protein